MLFWYSYFMVAKVWLVSPLFLSLSLTFLPPAFQLSIARFPSPKPIENSKRNFSKLHELRCVNYFVWKENDMIIVRALVSFVWTGVSDGVYGFVHKKGANAQTKSMASSS